MPDVVALFLKPRAGAPMLRTARVRGVAGLGLEDDVNASASSPRHVLIASADDVGAMHLRRDALRANIILDRGARDLSSGDVLRLGSLSLRITIRCEACGRLNDERRGLSREVGERRGVLARVLHDGIVEEGARAMRIVGLLPPLPDDWHARVRQIVHAIPVGRVVTYANLAEIAGVQHVYCRAVPTVLRRIALDGAPVHRVIPADPRRVATGAARRLAEEGVTTIDRTVHWSTESYYRRQEG